MTLCYLPSNGLHSVQCLLASKFTIISTGSSVNFPNTLLTLPRILLLTVLRLNCLLFRFFLTLEVLLGYFSTDDPKYQPTQTTVTPARLLCGRRSLRSWVSSRLAMPSSVHVTIHNFELNLVGVQMELQRFNFSVPSLYDSIEQQDVLLWSMSHLRPAEPGSHGEAEPAGACVAHRFDTSREEKRKNPAARWRIGQGTDWNRFWEGPRIFCLTLFCEMGKLAGYLPLVACFFLLCTDLVESQTMIRNTSHCPLFLTI